MSFSGLTTLAQAANSISQKRTNIQQENAPVEEEGWEIINLQKNQLILKEEVNQTAPATLLNVTENTKVIDVFFRMITPELVSHILQVRTKMQPSVFVDNKGVGSVKWRVIGHKAVYHYLACRCLIHSRQKKMGDTVLKALKTAKYILERDTGKQIVGIQKLNRVHRLFYFQFGKEESILKNIIQSIV